MKKIILGISAVCFFMIANTNDAKAQGPTLKAENMTVDFGEVSYGGDGTREFTFTNTGNEPLLITNAKGSCGCTVPEWPKEPIRAGGTGVIKIKYDTKRAGPISKTVTVTTNEVESKDANGNPVYKNHVVTIKGTVKAAPTTDGTPTKNTNGAPVE
jgi:hypothetical protein